MLHLTKVQSSCLNKHDKSAKEFVTFFFYTVNSLEIHQLVLFCAVHRVFNEATEENTKS